MDKDHLDVCLTLAIASVVLKKVRLKHAMHLPLAVFKNKEGKVNYVTHANIKRRTNW